MHIRFANFHVKLKPDGAEHNSKYLTYLDVHMNTNPSDAAKLFRLSPIYPRLA